MDRLSALLTHFRLHATTYYSGGLCGTAEYDGQDSQGHLHLLRAGRVRIQAERLQVYEIEEPTLILFPRPAPHALIADTADHAELVCASLTFDGGIDNPLTLALPGHLHLPLSQLPNLAGNLEWLFQEAFNEECGRFAVLNRLFELMLIQLLRHLLATRSLSTGLMAGLADPRLARALTLMHDAPHQAWSVDTLAQACNMSRAGFAARFREIVGSTPADYLLGWRVSLVQKRLREGRPIALIADEVGYESPSALSRAFRRKVGKSPREWLSATQAS
ncbi:AraC family transcriptional regulator [Ectopseudomonas toyotomiensis]|uniref:AraC family transcriptional regulator n=1 Tax=Ectopseudomonas toyotomiensis TaxID=554344 RepID=A0ABD7E2Q3_9GAMM|nr:AraC family transcriptional regulator [Pseudomonas toyotomiensis]QSL94976.1 AraC family transcriptional regulator [Pseudomonas toyotomiensis]